MKRPNRALWMLRLPERIRADYLICGLVFLIGSALGHLLGGVLCTKDDRELSEYILTFARAAPRAEGLSFANVLFSYFRACGAVFLLGFTACGSWLIPVLVAGQGCLLAYSVHCFGAALGRRGILLALAAFGVRCLFVLPCFFYLAVRSRGSALRVRDGKMRREKVEMGLKSFYAVLLCGAALLVGCLVEMTLVPRLIALILSNLS